ncbi:CAMP-dependent protein kinase type ii regulatory subunit-like [Plakobranchus ocellatus]|uniref:cAMP-dependent protein kinase type ii regulatory subunit-like n=1 Tax=Plakobranchus ocellatus TaxID=259542 RepID=A0AAV4B462_9GAST|nr:CAMP-dependent protein kinase type ii regulatory subunit-like [Plakobranchus ocellatus]
MHKTKHNTLAHIKNTTGTKQSEKYQEWVLGIEYATSTIRTAPPPPSRDRRKSVSAERYDPEDDDDEDYVKVINPKSDDQRKRLNDAIKHILLFRSLDQEQMQEVLDAMFEKAVSRISSYIKITSTFTARVEALDAFCINEKPRSVCVCVCVCGLCLLKQKREAPPKEH